MDQRAPRGAPVPGTRAAQAPRRARLVRPDRPRCRRSAGRARARARNPRVLLLLLLVQRPAPARAAARGDARARHAGLPVLRLLGERELDAPLGRRRRPDPDGAALRGRGQRPPVRRVPPAVSRPALRARARAAAAAGLQGDADPRRRGHDDDVAAPGGGDRDARALPGRLRDRGPRRRRPRGVRRARRVPAARPPCGLDERASARARAGLHRRRDELPRAGAAVAQARRRRARDAALRVPGLGQLRAARAARHGLRGVEPGAVRLLGRAHDRRHASPPRGRRARAVRERLERVGRRLLPRARRALRTPVPRGVPRRPGARIARAGRVARPSGVARGRARCRRRGRARRARGPSIRDAASARRLRCQRRHAGPQPRGLPGAHARVDRGADRAAERARRGRRRILRRERRGRRALRPHRAVPGDARATAQPRRARRHQSRHGALGVRHDRAHQLGRRLCAGPARAGRGGARAGTRARVVGRRVRRRSRRAGVGRGRRCGRGGDPGVARARRAHRRAHAHERRGVERQPRVPPLAARCDRRLRGARGLPRLGLRARGELRDRRRGRARAALPLPSARCQHVRDAAPRGPDRGRARAAAVPLADS